MGKAKDGQAKADDLGSRPEADRGVAESKVSEGEARSLKKETYQSAHNCYEWSGDSV